MHLNLHQIHWDVTFGQSSIIKDITYSVFSSTCTLFIKLRSHFKSRKKEEFKRIQENNKFHEHLM